MSDDGGWGGCATLVVWIVILGMCAGCIFR